MTDPDNINIYQLLNRFDNAFGHPRLGVHVSHISDQHIYLQVDYAYGADIPKERIWNDGFGEQEPGTHDLYAMVKIHVDSDKDEMAMRNYWLKDADMALTLSSMPYVNSHTMPDRSWADAFREAHDKVASELFPTCWVRPYEIDLGPRLLRQALASAKKEISCLEVTLSHLVTNGPDSLTHRPGISGNTFHNRMASLRHALDDSLLCYECIARCMERDKHALSGPKPEPKELTTS